MRRWKEFYGAHPLHLLGLLACFAVTGYAVLQLLPGPNTLRIAVWFVGAAVVHDLVLFPLYALFDRGLTRARRTVRPGRSRGAVNWVRVPALLSGLLLLLFWPVITQHSEPAYNRASGLLQNPYLDRYLAIVAALFLASGLLYLATRLRSRR